MGNIFPKWLQNQPYDKSTGKIQRKPKRKGGREKAFRSACYAKPGSWLLAETEIRFKQLVLVCRHQFAQKGNLVLMIENPYTDSPTVFFTDFPFR